MRISFDPEKDVANVAKHGVSLALAADLDWSEAAVWEDRRRDYGEVRYVALAPLERHLYYVAFTERGTQMRIISLRKANRREVDRYEAEIDSTDEQRGCADHSGGARRFRCSTYRRRRWIEARAWAPSQSRYAIDGIAARRSRRARRLACVGPGLADARQRVAARCGDEGEGVR